MMKLWNITRWLMVGALLAGCSGAAAPLRQAAPVTPEGVYAFVTVGTTVTPLDAPNGGGLTADEPTVDAAGRVVVTLAPTIVPPTATVIATASATAVAAPIAAPTATQTATPTPSPWSVEPHPLQIEVMRRQAYPGSAITVEQALEPGANYSRAIVSYRSDGFKINALMTVPTGAKPATGWPAIVFNHGYIAPAQYSATKRYVAYVDAIARSGYIVFMSDYRGWANSEGGATVAGGGYGSPALTVDVLNAVASLQGYADADPDRIGMWGHSLGGQLTLRAMVVSNDIRAGAIWGGVVSPYPDIIERWDFMGRAGRSGRRPPSGAEAANWGRDFSGWVEEFSGRYGAAQKNPDFWDTISPNTYLADLSGPLALHHSVTDEMVPLAWSETLAAELTAANQPFEFYTYPGDNHNISKNFIVAMERTVAFFDRYVKDGGDAR